MGFFKKFKEAWLASMTFDKLDDEFYEELAVSYTHLTLPTTERG